MGLIKHIREVFSGFARVRQAPGGSVGARMQSNSFVNFVINLFSDWDTKQEEEIFQDMYCYDDAVGGGIDRVSTMCGQAFIGFEACSNEEMFTDGPPPDKKKLDEMVRRANYLKIKNDLSSVAATYGGVLSMYGLLVLHEDPGTYDIDILPNSLITFLDYESRITTPPTDIKKQVITKANIVCVNEPVPDLMDKYPVSECYIVKMRDIPLWAKDRLCRLTYGLYPVSPLQRAIIPVWQKSIIIAIDAMWRWANVPRDHHKLNSEMFSLDKFPGSDMVSVVDQSIKAADKVIKAYAAEVSAKAPDQGYVTLDTVTIEPLEHANAGYMAPNDLLTQISDQVWGAIAIPKSIVTGVSGNSYASELTIANYTNTMILHLAGRATIPILENMKKRLQSYNKGYPVDYLKVKLEFKLATTELDEIKRGAAMASTNCYTIDECRNETGHSHLDPKDYDKMPGAVNAASSMKNEMNYPDTPQSANQRPTVAGMSKAEKSVSAT